MNFKIKLNFNEFWQLHLFANMIALDFIYIVISSDTKRRGDMCLYLQTFINHYHLKLLSRGVSIHASFLSVNYLI